MNKFLDVQERYTGLSKLSASPVPGAGLPAARLGDMTAHGGVITTGSHDVVIGWKPAARMADMHTCPMVEPGPVPHVGGPVLPPCSPTVMINFRPASRVSDRCTCVGPPDPNATGEITVLIG